MNWIDTSQQRRSFINTIMKKAKKRFHHYKIVKQSALNKIIQASPEDHPEIK